MKQVAMILAAQVALVSGMTTVASAAGAWGLQSGTVELKSAGPMTFGPDGILIVGDTKSAAIIAIDTEDRESGSTPAKFDVENLNGRLSDDFGGKVTIADVAVNPASGNVYLSASAGGKAMIYRLLPSGEISIVSLEKVPHARVELMDAPEDKFTGQGRRRKNRRAESITDLAYSDGRILVSGLTNSKSPSTVREFDFPFQATSTATIVEIYHGAHGKFEDYSAIRAFVPFNIEGKPSLLAGFTCTPLVKFPLDALQDGSKVRGTTVAELGNRNRPLDMIVYKQAGKNYLLMANTARGVMKISTDQIERSEGITERVSGTAGQTYETIEELKNVAQLDKLGESHAVILVQNENGSQDLQTIALP